jgi:predicted RNase H-like HicB family nuclease
VRQVKATVEVAGRKYAVVVQADVVDGGFIAECPALKGCVTDGETPEEALRNIRDAIEDWRNAGRSRHLAKAQ